MLAWVATTPMYGPERAMVEEFVVIHLQRLHYLAGGYARFIGYYNGELDTEQGANDLLTHVRNEGLPGILVATGAGTYEPKSTTARHYAEHLQVEVLFASAHVRAYPTRLRGDVASGDDDLDLDAYPTKDPGIYRMMRDVRDVLLGFSPELEGVGKMKILREDVVLQTPAITLWRVVYGCAYHYATRSRESRLPNAANSLQIDYNLIESVDDASLINPIITQERTV